MATTAVTTEVSSGLPVGAGPATSVSSSSAQPTPTSSNALNSAPEGATSSAGQSTELSPQDFGSLEDYAQALIDKKQSAVQSSEAENGAQAGAAAVPGEQDKDAWLEAGDQESLAWDRWPRITAGR